MKAIMLKIGDKVEMFNGTTGEFIDYTFPNIQLQTHSNGVIECRQVNIKKINDIECHNGFDIIIDPRKPKPETPTISHDDDMISTISKHFTIKTGKEQKLGSSADIYAERCTNDGGLFFMLIDDGNVENQLQDARYHIYAYDFDGKIFQGRITSKAEFEIVMKVLGFTEDVSKPNLFSTERLTFKKLCNQVDELMDETGELLTEIERLKIVENQLYEERIERGVKIASTTLVLASGMRQTDNGDFIIEKDAVIELLKLWE